MINEIKQMIENKKAMIKGGFSGTTNNIVNIIVIFALLGSTMATIIIYWNNFTDALSAGGLPLVALISVGGLGGILFVIMIVKWFLAKFGGGK